jgi:hypothetical protein
MTNPIPASPRADTPGPQCASRRPISDMTRGPIRFELHEVRSYYASRVPTFRQTESGKWRGPCPIHRGNRDIHDK